MDEPWSFMDPPLAPTQLTELFEYYTSEILDIFCPSKVVVSRPGEKPWITEEIKNMKRRLQRQYEKKGQSPKYLELKSLYDTKNEG